MTLESTATGRDVVNHIRGNIAPFGHHQVTKHKKSWTQMIDNATKNVSKSPASHILLEQKLIPAHPAWPGGEAERDLGGAGCGGWRDPGPQGR